VAPSPYQGERVDPEGSVLEAGVAADSFTRFVHEVEPPLRHALTASLGQERGREATAEALAWAWEHSDQALGLEHPVGYLFRVGKSCVRVRRRFRPLFDPVPNGDLPHVEPGLPTAMRALSEQQRVAVVLVHAYGWDRKETAHLLGTSVSTLDTHLNRGLEKLRAALGVELDD
jgi:DNA-directed RNA polymerase specialized sigma24 family protein